jgi:hypothetical protein
LVLEPGVRSVNLAPIAAVVPCQVETSRLATMSGSILAVGDQVDNGIRSAVGFGSD